MKRIISLVLVALMIISILPISVVAASVEDSLEQANFTVIDNDKSTLAPGVTMEELVLHNKNNQRVEMYVTTVNTTVDTVKVMANYMDNQNTVYGMQTLTAQVAAMEANYPEPFKIVAGINASYYNVNNGKPTGAFVMEGVDVTSEAEGNNYSFFAVLKDGTYMIGAKGEYSKYKGQIQEAIGGYIHLVKDGKVVSGLDKTTLYPRQTLGLTADGKLILMTADGAQAPVTVGITIQEQAEIMLELGCVEAIHLDGGNSLTFGAIREGEEEFKTVNSPAGGAERAVSNTLVIVSTAVADGTFDHAVIKSDYEYIAPNSTYTFSAFGVDATNAAAEIPETAVWTLSDNSFGTISNGKFVSSGKLGKVDIQITVDGKVVGSKSVTIVNPTTAAFDLEETTVPYGKTATIPVTAMYGDFNIYTDDSHYSFAVNANTAGTMEGFKFTATNDETVQSAVITATYKYAESVTDTINVKFGKGSEVLFDFEDGDISDWKGTDEYEEWRQSYNGNNPPYQLYDPHKYSNNIDKQSSSVFLATEENGGHVKSGEYSLGFRLNHTQLTEVGSWVYNYLYYTGDTKVLRDVANGQTAIRIGMWLYSPDITNVAFRLVRGTTSGDGKVGIKYSYMTSDYDGIKTSYATNYAIPESGWIYVYYDLTDLTDDIVQTTSISGATLNVTNANADYFPAFLQLFTGTGTDTMEDMVFYIDDITLDYSNVTEDRDAPTISDTEVCYDTANFVAINGQKVNNNLLSFSAKVTDVSGNSNMTGLNYATAKIYIDGIDVSGNNGFKAANGYITLNDIYLTNGKHSIAFVIFDNQGNETRLTKTIVVEGSADNSVVSVVAHNDGNNVPKAGSVYFIDIKASDAAKIKEITTVLKLNTANKFEYENIVCADGVKAIATYDPLNFEVTVTLTHDGSLNGDAILASIPVRVWAWDEEYTGITADKQFATGAIPTIDIEFKTVYGEVTYVDNTYGNYVCGFYGEFDVATELDNKTDWHKHNAVAIDDKAVTCTKDGYIGRTYCADCASVIDWGTTVEATGHSYGIVGNKIACACGDVNTANGLHNINGVNYYVLAGELASGWISVEEDWYYFDSTTFAGLDGEKYADNGVKFTFDNGRVTTGVWVKDAKGLRYWYGPGYYRDMSIDATSCRAYEIDGKTYLFSRQGYMQTGIVYWMYRLLGSTGEVLYYNCGTDGVATLLNGVYKNRFYIDGVQQVAYQLIDFEGSLYFVGDGHMIAVNKKVYLSKSYVTGMTIPDGWYNFDAEGKLIVPDTKNGPQDDGFFYIDSVKQNGWKIYKYEGNYYYVASGNKYVKNARMYLSTEVWADMTLPAGWYNFDAEGKLIIPPVKNGPQDDGYFYIENVRQNGWKIYEYEGNYYYVASGNKYVKDARMYLSTEVWADMILPAGWYNFDAEGKLIMPPTKNGPQDDGYFYIENVRQNGWKIYEYEGNYYYVASGNKYVKNSRMYLSTEVWADMPLPAGWYNFDADGKLIIPNPKNGPQDDGYFYINSIKQTGWKIYEYEGNYYYVASGNQYVKNARMYLSTEVWADMTLPAGWYNFDASGKLILK